MSVYFSSYSYKNSDFGKNNGSILDIKLSGGIEPYTVVWSGSNNYHTTPVDGSPSTDLINLPPGTYSGFVIDNLHVSGTTEIEIKEKENLILDTSIIDNSCSTGGCSCKIAVIGFTHESVNFRYDLYKDDIKVDYYTGKTGDEYHIFTGICSNSTYKVVGYETSEIIYQYNHSINDCETGEVTTTNPDEILNSWTHASLFTPAKLNGKPLGLNPDGTVNSGDPSVYLYTGSSNYKGVHNYIMNEGDNSGTTSPVINDFYYNSYINKFVTYQTRCQSGFVTVDTITTYVDGEGWVTINPTLNQGIIGNPRIDSINNNPQYWSTSLLSNTSTLMTINDSNIVIHGKDIVTTYGQPTFLYNKLNANMFAGFISTCKYTNYVHEVTFTSMATDNDTIGIVLCWFRDDDGYFGAKGISHNISMLMNRGSDTNNILINYNNTTNLGVNEGITGSSIYSFTDGINYSSRILKRDFISGNTVIGSGNWNEGTSTYVSYRTKITRSGTYGQLFKIEFTDSMAQYFYGTKHLGDSNPYNNNYKIEFDLTDKSTWVDAPNYAEGTELNKFLGSQSYGYFSTSQSNSTFYDIKFNGLQDNVTPTIVTELSTLSGESINYINSTEPTPSGQISGQCITITPICSSSFNKISETPVQSELFIDIVDTSNTLSNCFIITPLIINDPCPTIETTSCGCPCADCDHSIRIDIKKKNTDS